ENEALELAVALDRTRSRWVWRLSFPELAPHRRSFHGFPDAQRHFLNVGCRALGRHARSPWDHDGLETGSGGNGWNPGIRVCLDRFNRGRHELDKATTGLRDVDDR